MAFDATTALATFLRNLAGSVGYGTPVIRAIGRTVAATNAATASVATFTVGAADGTFEVSYDALIVSGATFSFTVEVAFTDEGNSARVTTLDANGSGAGTGALQYATTLAAAGGAIHYAGRPLTLRCKAATAITVRTQAAGTYTAVVYNIEGLIKQVA